MASVAAVERGDVEAALRALVVIRDHLAEAGDGVLLIEANRLITDTRILGQRIGHDVRF